MEQNELMKVVNKAAEERGCFVYELKFDDDDNVFEVTIDKQEAGLKIKVALTEFETYAVDTPEDLERINAMK